MHHRYNVLARNEWCVCVFRPTASICANVPWQLFFGWRSVDLRRVASAYELRYLLLQMRARRHAMYHGTPSQALEYAPPRRRITVGIATQYGT